MSCTDARACCKIAGGAVSGVPLLKGGFGAYSMWSWMVRAASSPRNSAARRSAPPGRSQWVMGGSRHHDTDRTGANSMPAQTVVSIAQNKATPKPLSLARFNFMGPWSDTYGAPRAGPSSPRDIHPRKPPPVHDGGGFSKQRCGYFLTSGHSLDARGLAASSGAIVATSL